MSRPTRAPWIALNLAALALLANAFRTNPSSTTGFGRLASAAVSIGGTGGWQQAPLKIAYVNTQTLVNAAPGRAAADSVLNREGVVYRIQLARMSDSINTLLAKLQKEGPTLTAAARDKSQKTIQTLEAEYQAKQAEDQQKMQQRQSEVMAPVTDLVKKVIDDIREEGGFALILSNEPIVASDKNLDITDRVVSRLRATPAPKLPERPGVTKPPQE